MLIVEGGSALGEVACHNESPYNEFRMPSVNYSVNPAVSAQYVFIAGAPGKNNQTTHSAVQSIVLAGDPRQHTQGDMVQYWKNNSKIGKVAHRTVEIAGNTKASSATFESAGADYAEYMDQLDPEELITPGDVVGVYSGQITKRTAGADRIMVVSTVPLVIGNWKGDDDTVKRHPVAFIGQVPVKVTGAVTSGQWLRPSGKADGRAMAMTSAEHITYAREAIGQAWETVTGNGGALVNTAVGIGTPPITTDAIRAIRADD